MAQTEDDAGNGSGFGVQLHVASSQLSHVLLLFCALSLSAPAAAAAPKAPDQIRSELLEAAVQIFVYARPEGARCMGWIGYSDAVRSAIYTAAHCRISDARYRVIFTTGGGATATAAVWWPTVDFMALWIPLGNLPTVRMWKPVPPPPFRALQVIASGSGSFTMVETDVRHVDRVTRFRNTPTAIGLPLRSMPGDSGSPIADASDGVLIGMLVGSVPSLGVKTVIPADVIYRTLSTTK